MSKHSERIERQAEALEYLREALKPGDTVYTVVTHVSSSGMSRRIMVLIPTGDGIRNISYLIANAGLFKRSRGDDNTVTVGGAGMDMGFHVVYSLGRALFPDYADEHGHRDGGYALTQRWL